MSELPIDLRPATECVGFAVRRASRAVSQHYDEALRPTGLRNSQFTLLVALDQIGEVSVGALAGWMCMDRTTLTRNAALLERRGLVSSRGHANDRRSRILGLTTDGRRVAREAFPYWQRAQRELSELIGSDALQSLVGEMDGLVERLDPAGD